MLKLDDLENGERRVQDQTRPYLIAVEDEDGVQFKFKFKLKMEVVAWRGGHTT